MENNIDITPDLLATMYNKQYALQCFMKEKRNLTLPPDKTSSYITHQHVLAAIYFFSCVNIEWKEVSEAYAEYLEAESPEQQEVLRLNALEEVIDTWHFILSVFIFLGIKEEKVRKLTHFQLGGLESLAEYVGSTSLAISSVLSDVPYKTWKDQHNLKELSDSYQDDLLGKLSVCYNDVLDFALYNLNATHAEFVNAYMKKNELNFRRQEDRKFGYIK